MGLTGTSDVFTEEPQKQPLLRYCSQYICTQLLIKIMLMPVCKVI